MNNSIQVEKKEANEDKSEYIHGIRGWLLVFIIFLGFYSWGWLSPLIRDFDGWIIRFHLWKLAYFLLSCFINLFGIVTPLLIIYLLIRKRKNAVLFSKAFLILVPFVNVINEYFYDLYSFSVLVSYFFVSIFSLGITVPWILYLINSVRIANTFLLTENKFSKVIDCPFCSERMGLENDERIKKIAICPNCGATISKQTVAA